MNLKGVGLYPVLGEVPNLNPTATLGCLLRDCAFSRDFLLRPFGDFCPFLRLKLYDWHYFALLRHLLTLFILFPLLFCWIRKGSMDKEGSWRLGLNSHLGGRSPACDFRSSRRLVFCLHWSTMALGILDGSWLLLTYVKGKWEKVASRDSVGKDWSKTPKSSLKSSLESTTSITLVASSSRTGFEVTSSLEARWVGSSTEWVLTGGGPLRKLGTAILIWCSWGSFTFMMYLGDWKLVDIGLYSRMMWVARNCLSVWRKISDLRILVRSGSLMKLRLGAVKFLSAKIPKIKVSLERKFVN